MLRSGITSNYYFDKYLFETKPNLLRRVASFLAELVPQGTDRLAGPELGGVALATAVSLDLGLPFVIVRILDPARAELYSGLGLQIICPTKTAIETLTNRVLESAARAREEAKA